MTTTIQERVTTTGWLASFHRSVEKTTPTVRVREVQVERRDDRVLVHNDDGTIERHYSCLSDYCVLFDTEREARDWIAEKCEAVAAGYAATAREYRG